MRFLAADVTTPDFGIAAEGTEVVTPSGWTFTFAPYLWAAGVSGDIGVAGLPPEDVDASFGDILENLDIAAMLVGEARYGRFGIFSDFVYVEVSSSENAPVGIPANRVDLTSSTLFWTVAGEYRVMETPTATIDVMAGARLVGPRNRFRPGRWRPRRNVAERRPKLGGSAGGRQGVRRSFGQVVPVRGGSNRRLRCRFGLHVDFWGVAGYRFTDAFSLVAGYRGLGVDYSNGGFVFDIVQHGPVLGAGFRF